MHYPSQAIHLILSRELNNQWMSLFIKSNLLLPHERNCPADSTFHLDELHLLVHRIRQSDQCSDLGPVCWKFHDNH